MGFGHGNNRRPLQGQSVPSIREDVKITLNDVFDLWDTIPEMACVGLSDDEAAKRYPGERIIVGRCRFEEVARGQISGVQDGLLKIIADHTGHKLLGVQIVGEGATELIHLGQMALLSGTSVESFVENIFNFPTLAEAYRVAALDVLERSR